MRQVGLAFLGSLALLLGAVAPADAAGVSMTSQGLVVTSVGDSDGDFFISPSLSTPGGEVSKWKVSVSGCDIFETHTCLGLSGSGSHCVLTPLLPAGNLGTSAECDRTHAGITLNAGAGDDEAGFASANDKVTVDLGAGNDELTTGEIGIFEIPTGKWTVTAGSGNDKVHGGGGGNTIDGGSGNDSLFGFPADSSLPGTAKGFELSGDDSIDGGDGDDTIDPGTGSDQVIGGSGDDLFKAGDESTIPGDFDSYSGGTGIDTISYASRTSDIFFNSGSVQSGSVGANPDEQDRVSGTNNVILGSGNDTAFSLLENLSKRRYEGRGGDDVLNGLDSPDTLIGGDGADKMNGFKGNDTIDARSDGFADKLISCGDGTDSVQEDLKDPLPVDLDKCETLVRGNKSEPAFLRILGAQRGANGILRADLKCPKANGKSCEGRLSARGTSRHYSIAAGKTETVSLGAVGGRRVTLRANEEGEFGPETVSRQLKLS